MTEPFTRNSEIEMEDGREAVITGFYARIGQLGEDLVQVRLKGQVYKGGPAETHHNSWWYSCVTGEFDGDQGRGHYFRIVHKEQPSNIPEEW